MNNKFFKGIIVGMAIALALICLTAGVFMIVTNRNKGDDRVPYLEEGMSSGGQIKPGDGSSSGSSSNVDGDTKLKQNFEKKFEIIYDMLDRYYLDEYDKEEMLDRMLSGMMASLGDPYSVYYNPKDYSDLLETTSGRYCGIGAMVSQSINDKKLIVVAPFPDSPAYTAGMRPGDEIISIDGENVAGEDINLVVSKMKGEKGTDVAVGVLRDGEEIILTITRDEIKMTFVDSKMLENGIGYVEISQFYELTYEQLDSHIKQLVDQGANKFILDLRGNPGGLYDDVVKCLDLFIEKNNLLVYTEDKTGHREEEYTKNDVKYDYPMVILVDDQSASAAEIFSGTMQCYKKATIVGTQTFGKGIVQAIYPITVDKSGIKLTISKYYLPNGVCIHKIGITPDVVVELDEELKNIVPAAREYDNQLNAAVDFLQHK